MKTKNIISSLLLMGGLFSTSCSDYLAVSDELASNLTIDQAFESVSNTRQWHNNIFTAFPQSSQMFAMPNGRSNGWGALCNELSFSNSTSYNMRDVMIGGFTASNAPLQRFSLYYPLIRQALIFMERAKPIGLSENSVGDYLTEEEIARMKNECKVMMALYYTNLFELYGPVPVVTEILDPAQTKFDFSRPSVDEFVGYVDNLLVEALNSHALPKTLRQVDPETGVESEYMYEMARPTEACILALRAKLAVFAASKLFNGGYKEALALKNKDGKRLFPDYDPNKWNIAKQRCKEFVEFAEANGYELVVVRDKDGNILPGESVYQSTQDYSRECIWAHTSTCFDKVNHSSGVDQRYTPRNCGGTACIGVPQDMIDAFFTKNGLDIKEDPEYTEVGFTDLPNPCANKKPQVDKHIWNAWVNREPRFYQDITYEGKSWHIQPRAGYQCFMHKGGNADDSQFQYQSFSGYFLYKRCCHKTHNSGKNPKRYLRPDIMFRLADFYLYYAEACNEVDPSDPNIIKYLDKVRERAGIPGYQELKDKGIKNIIGDKEKQAYAIRRERQIELFSEGQRFFDVRRWMICEDKEAQQAEHWGMDVNGSPDIEPGQIGSFYTRTLVRRYVWDRKMYLHPIPHNELEMNPSLVQNPGW